MGAVNAVAGNLRSLFLRRHCSGHRSALPKRLFVLHLPYRCGAGELLEGECSRTLWMEEKGFLSYLVPASSLPCPARGSILPFSAPRSFTRVHVEPQMGWVACRALGLSTPSQMSPACPAPNTPLPPPRDALRHCRVWQGCEPCKISSELERVRPLSISVLLSTFAYGAASPQGLTCGAVAESGATGRQSQESGLELALGSGGHSPSRCRVPGFQKGAGEGMGRARFLFPLNEEAAEEEGRRERDWADKMKGVRTPEF